MDENRFSLKCDAHAVKVNYDSSEKISVIKVYPEHNSDIKIILGKHRVNISDDKPRTKCSRKQG